MSVRFGVVINVEDGQALVRTPKEEHCATCSHKGACGAMGGGGDGMEYQATDDLGTAPGDRVELFMPERTHLKAGIIAFLFPMLALLGGAGAGAAIAGPLNWPADLTAVCCALVGLALTLLGIKLFDRRAANDPAYRMRITRIISSDGGCEVTEDDGQGDPTDS